MRVCVLLALLGFCLAAEIEAGAEASITAEADAAIEAAAKAALEAGVGTVIEAGVETVIDETPAEEFGFGDADKSEKKSSGGGLGSLGASHFDDVPKASFQGKSASLTHGDYTFKYPAWYKTEINAAVGMQPVFQISITKSKATTIYYYILHGPYSNTWVYKGYPVSASGRKSKRAKFMHGSVPYRVWWRKHCKYSTFSGEYKCMMCFRLDKLTGAMDYGQASATVGSYTFSKPVYQVDDEGKAGKFGMMQFTVKKDSSKTMMYLMGGPLKGNFVSVSRMTGDLKITKLPIHVYKREYCRDHIGHRACRWCFTFVAYTGMVLPPPSYSITVGSDTVKIHDPQVTQVGLHGGKVHVARYMFNHNNGVHSMYYVIDGKDAGKWFVINRGAGAPLSGSAKKKKSAFAADDEDDENEDKVGAKMSLVYLTVPLYVYTRQSCTKKGDKDHCDWAIRTYKTSEATPSKEMTLGGKKYGTLKISGKAEGGVCEGGCKIITMEKGGAFSSKKYYHSMKGETKGKWFAEGFAGFGKTGLFDKYFLFEYKHCQKHSTKGNLCRYCYEFSETSTGFSGTGAAAGAGGERGPVSAGGATLKDPALEPKVKGISLGGGGGPGGDGGGGGANPLALPGKSKSQIMSVTVTYNKKTEKYYHIFSGPRAGLWLKTQTVGTRVKRQAIRPTDLPVLVFHHENCIQGFKGHSCRYCFRMKSRAGLAWTPIGAATSATADKITFKRESKKSPRYEQAASPHGDKGKKYKALIVQKDTGMDYIHYMEGPDAGIWYKDGTMGFAKATFTDGDLYSNYDCKMGIGKVICRDCFSFGGTSTAVSGGGVAPDDGDGGGASDGPEAMPGYTPKFTFGTDTPRCGVKMCKSKDYTKCLWVFYDKCFEKSSIDKAVKSFDNSGKCPFTVYADCAKKTSKGTFYPGDKKAYDAAQTWRKIVFGTCSASVCAAASYKSCKTITTHKCISEMGIDQIMGVKNTGMCPFVLHTTCSTGGTRYQVLPDETKDWGKKTTYTSLRFTPPAAKVCEATGYKTCTTVDSNRYCLEGDTIDANIAAVYNYAPAQMTLYKNCKFDGTSHTLIPGEKKDWGSAQAYSSIKFTPCVARICSKTKFTGCVTITDSVTCLKEVSMDNKVMSVINTGSCTLTLYKECTKGTTDTIGPGQARVYGDATAASWSAVKWTVPKAAPLDFGYWISHTEDDIVPPGGHYFMNDLNHIPLLNKQTYGIVLPDTTIADKKVLYHDKLADVVVMRKTWFHDDTNHVIRLAADTDYCITIATTDNSKDQDIILKTCAKGKYDQWTYDEATQQIQLKENTKRCIKKSASGDKKLKLQLKACATSGDTLDQWGIAKPASGATYQLSKAGLLPWKFKNTYAMAAKTEPKSKDINIVFKKYVGNTKDQWHYNTKHYTINNNKYPTIVMRVSGDVKTGTPIKTAVKKYDTKDQWTFDADNWLIKLKSNTKYCMMKAKYGFTEDVNIVLGECGTGSTKEKWGIEEVFTMTSASITDVKVMNTGHSMWQMKFGQHKHEPVRIKYTLGSDTYYLYYNYASPTSSTTAKCTASVKCGHLEKWYYIHGAKADATQGKTGTAIAVEKREWIDFPLKVTYSKSNGKYVVRLDCNKCST